ncbi:MAG TPA: outer membrane lipoprotein-sorting protein [Caldithrix abyssi]|uniref:Outer membrane lipoprotein-sorting protein n=1 Tax=Caldithrix abyssi TaxID=187145 RepID=A0A7V1PV07_CALAY|nr:outer membrane lipoprotein-sorting protein [Caldithrix abyssi]
MRTKHFFLTLAMFLTATPFMAVSQSTLTGLEIVQKAYDRPEGKDMQSELTMTLINSRGEKRVREIKQFRKDYKTVEKKIMFFMAPADVRNTSFMNWSYTKKGKDDDQWIYLPALKKTKRISSDSKSDYFMGSDFTYDDLGDRHPEDDTHKLLRQEKLNGEDCYVVESVPRDEEYMYSKTVSWIVKDKWLVIKKDFYDEDGEFFKTLTAKKFDNINGYWIITESEMHNMDKNHTTNMKLKNIIIDGGIADNKFTERMMKRGLR